MFSEGFCHKGKNDIQMWTPKQQFFAKKSIFDRIKLSNIQKKSGIYAFILHNYPILVRSTGIEPKSKWLKPL